MAIIHTAWSVSKPLTCAICGVSLSLARATAGLYYWDNRQSFSCVSHLSEVEKLITGWADFITAQLEECLKWGKEPANLTYREAGDAPDFTREEWLFEPAFGIKGLARHLFTRMSTGKIIIVTDKPAILHSSLRKQWLKLARKVQVERSRTLNVTRVLRTADMAAKMQNITFTTGWADGYGYQADVCIATVEQLAEWPPNCRTLYITCVISTQQLQLVVARMPVGSLVLLLQPT